MAENKNCDAEEIRKTAPSWSLDGDSKLLQYMESIADGLGGRMEKTKTNMENMILDLNYTKIALDVVTNKLAGLQDSQFVENRVYEDDEMINVKDLANNDKSETEEFNPTNMLEDIIKTGIDTMRQVSEKVSIDPEYLNEPKSDKNMIYRPVDPYRDVRLPYLIGSKEWRESWHIGLFDSDEAFDEENNANDLSSESGTAPSLSASLPSIAPTMSESECSVWGLHANVPSKDVNNFHGSSDDEASGPTFASKASLEDRKNRNASRSNSKQAQNAFMPNDTSERYYIHKPKENLFNDNKNNTREQPNIVKQPVLNINRPINKVSNILDDEPPDLDVVDQRERQPTNLFYDSDEDEKVSKDQNANINVKEDNVSTTVQNTRKKPVNLFDDDDFDSFMKELQSKNVQKLNETKPAKNLFDDDDENEDDVMANTKAKLENIFSKSTTVSNSTKKTDEESTTKKVSERNIFEEEDNLFSNNDNKSEKQEIPVPTKRKSIPTKTIISNLFDDNPPDDDFDSLFKIPTTKNETNSSNNASQDQKIYDSGSKKGNEQNTFAKNSVTKNLFDNFENDEEIDYKKTENKTVLKTNQNIESSENHLNKIKKGSTIKKNLFDDSDDDDLFESVIGSQSKKSASGANANSYLESIKKSKNIFDDFEDERTESNQIAIKEQNETKIEPISSSEKLEPKLKIEKVEEAKQVHNGPIKWPKPELPSKPEKPPVVKNNLANTDSIIHRNLEVENIFRAETKEVVENVSESNSANDPPPKVVDIEEDTDMNAEHTVKKISSLNNKEEIKQDEDHRNVKPVENEKGVSEAKSDSNIYSALFDSVPPGDAETKENISQKNDANDLIHESSNPSSMQETNKYERTSALSYNSVGLYEDIPPDDDFPVGNIKRLQNIFCDEMSDSSESKMAVERNVIPSSNYIFNDEPPPDEFTDTAGLLPIAKIKALEKKESESPEKPLPVARRPGKLNTNLAINVAALLPGAKRPNFQIDNVVNNESVAETIVLQSEGKENNNSVDVPSSNQVINIQQQENPDRLVNLTKSRVKIPVKRRPSTRKGRKENYIRSLVIDSEEESSENQDSRTDGYSSNDNSTSSNKPTSNVTKETATDVIVPLKTEENHPSENIVNVVEPSLDLPPPLSEEKLPKVVISSKFEGDSSLSKTKIFDDSEEDDDDDWLVQATKKLNNNEKLYVGTVPRSPEISSSVEENKIKISPDDNGNLVTDAKKPHLHIENPEDDDGWIRNKPEGHASASFPEQNESFNKVETDTNKKTNARVNTFKENDYKSHLFDSSDDDDFLKPSKTKNSNKGTIPKAPIKVEVNKNSILKSAASNSKINDKRNALFDSSEDEDNFKVSKNIKPPSKSETSTKTDKFNKVSSTKENEKKIRLFDESSDDDDDLFKSFAKKNEKPRAIKQTQPSATNQNQQKSNRKIETKQSHSLFSSDDDDDLFPNTMKKIESRNIHVASKSGTLFGDVDVNGDDDDIFGSASIKRKVTTTKVQKKVVIPERKIADNPLADLLDD